MAAPETRARLTCFLCLRAIGTKVEWHHPVPRSRGGRHTEPVHPICHRAIHATFTNKELERSFASADALRAHPDMRRSCCSSRTRNPISTRRPGAEAERVPAERPPLPLRHGPDPSGGRLAQ
jgi:hypothetical protein